MFSRIWESADNRHGAQRIIFISLENKHLRTELTGVTATWPHWASSRVWGSQHAPRRKGSIEASAGQERASYQGCVHRGAWYMCVHMCSVCMCGVHTCACRCACCKYVHVVCTHMCSYVFAGACRCAWCKCVGGAHSACRCVHVLAGVCAHVLTGMCISVCV